MADFFVGPVMEKLIDACVEYSKDQVRWQTGMNEELQRLRDSLPNIQAVVSAYSQEQIGDQNGHLNRWLWKLRDAIDEADDVLDLIEYRKLAKQVSNKKKDDVLDLIEYRKLEKQASKKKKDDVHDLIEYRKHEKQVSKNKKLKSKQVCSRLKFYR